MPMSPYYSTGTITVNNGATDVAGSGTAWATALPDGFYFELQAKGYTIPVDSIGGNGALTLAEPWPGGNLSGASYRIKYVNPGAVLAAKTIELLNLLGDGDLQAIAALAAADGTYLHRAGGAWIAAADTAVAGFVIDGGSNPITAGLKGFIQIPFDHRITATALFGKPSGSIAVDLWRCSYTAFDGGVTHPAAGDKITSSTPPTITSSTKSQDSTLSGWSTSGSAGAVYGINVNSCTNITNVTLVITLKKT